jgi:hypothetical protein
MAARAFQLRRAAAAGAPQQPDAAAARHHFWYGPQPDIPSVSRRTAK